MDESLEDLLYDLIDKLIRLCVVLEPVESIMYANELANKALNTVVLSMMCGMMESDTIGNKENRRFIADPVSEWVPWANAIRDELGYE